MNWRIRREMKAGVSQVVAEARRVVDGKVIERRPMRFADPWPGVNKLAHATWRDLDEVAGRRCSSSTSPWDGAVTFLAAEVRAVSGSADDLLALQREVLVPLELDLLSGRVAAPHTPVGLVSMVRRELARTGRHTGWCDPPGGPSSSLAD